MSDNAAPTEGPWNNQDPSIAFSSDINRQFNPETSSRQRQALYGQQQVQTEPRRVREEAKNDRRSALEFAIRCGQPHMTAAATIAEARIFEAYLATDDRDDLSTD